MYLRFVAVIALLASVATVSAEQFSFDGYKVWTVGATNENQLKVLRQWQQSEMADFWENPSMSAKSVRVMVEPRNQKMFLKMLVENHIQHALLIDNLENSFSKEREYDTNYRLKKLLNKTALGNQTDFEHYWEIDEIYEYLDYLEREHPDLVSTEVILNSTQNRPLRIVNVSLTGRGQVNGSRPIIFIDGGIHAREWIAQHNGLYFLKQLVENRTANQEILEALDFIILPVVNPDGYRYSRYAYRMWRKTMREFEVNEIGLVCYGVDGNRNYEFMWRNATESRVTTCNETYPGTKPFSEAEAETVHIVLDRHSTDIKMYFSFHSYGNYVLYPWGFEPTLIENWQLHDEIGQIYADTIQQATGTNYTVGNSGILFSPIFGSSDDYAAFVGVQAAFTIELTGGGPTGFDVPADQIESVLNESWLGFRNVLLFAKEHDWDQYNEK